jgi:hypothetical protein
MEVAVIMVLKGIGLVLALILFGTFLFFIVARFFTSGLMIAFSNRGGQFLIGIGIGIACLGGAICFLGNWLHRFVKG